MKSKKLTLQATTVRKLNAEVLRQLHGGAAAPMAPLAQQLHTIPKQ